MEFKLNIDKVTSYIYKSLDILFLMKPERTAYGIILGGFILGAKDAICGLISDKAAAFAANLKWYSVLFFGILIVRFDILFYREKLDEEMLKKLNSLNRIIKESNLTELQKRQMFKKLIVSSIEKLKAEDSDKSSETVQ